MLHAFIDPPKTRSSVSWTLIAGLILAIGVLDYLSGTDASLAIFYLVPVLLITGWRGARSGVTVAAACTVTRIASDGLAMPRGESLWNLYWNALASFAIAGLVIWLLDALLTLHRELERKIAARTAELEQSVAERGRLEREVLEASARERTAFGQELHDDIGQHLVATALAVQALAQRLTGPLATEAQAVVDWTEQAVAKTRRLAQGLLLAEINPGRLVHELEELASVARQAHIVLNVEHDGKPIDATALECAHLFRIAQEAVSNAIRHAQATSIKISVAERDGMFYLGIDDDGIGIQRQRRSSGMGLQIMTHRARLIGAQVSVEPRRPAGTRVACTLPHRIPP
jgi:signal transduction histidine kinase